MSSYTKKQVGDLVDGNLDWHTIRRMLALPKDLERFKNYLEVLQERVPFEDKIVMALGPHLYIVQDKDSKQWVNKCDCGHVYGDYRTNWKLDAHIYVRETDEKLGEIHPHLMAPDPEWQVYREFTCPSCGVLHDVEAPTPWYPILHNFQPDIETFYNEWVNLPLPERAEP